MRKFQYMLGLLMFLVTNISLQSLSNSTVTGPQITWPIDFMITIDDMNNLEELTDPVSLEQPYKEPMVTGPCGKGYGIAYTDQLFTIDGCNKLLRTWEVADWCDYHPGMYTHVQVIIVIVTDGPLVPCEP